MVSPRLVFCPGAGHSLLAHVPRNGANPTNSFTDANWMSMTGIPGAGNTVYAEAMDGSGNLYIGGERSHWPGAWPPPTLRDGTATVGRRWVQEWITTFGRSRHGAGTYTQAAVSRLPEERYLCS